MDSVWSELSWMSKTMDVNQKIKSNQATQYSLTNKNKVGFVVQLGNGIGNQSSNPG